MNGLRCLAFLLGYSAFAAAASESKSSCVVFPRCCVSFFCKEYFAKNMAIPLFGRALKVGTKLGD